MYGSPFKLGPKTFGSEGHARFYFRKLMERTPAGREIATMESDDGLALADLVRRYPYYSTMIEPFGILGFTVKDHCGSKILVVLLGAVTGRPPHTRIRERDVSIDRCFRTNFRAIYHTKASNVNARTTQQWREDAA